MDEVHLFKALDIAGKESLEILRLAYANSSFQAGLLASFRHLACSAKLHSWTHKQSLPDDHNSNINFLLL